jgi:ABC-2 type transport system ATP-binding protein
MPAAILVRGLTKRFHGPAGPVDAVAGLDLEVRTGECFGLLGPNGAGKTTTVEILEGLLEPTAGEVVVLGQRWSEPEGRRRALRQRLGVSLQETRLEEKLTVRETLALFRSFYDRSWTVAEALEWVGLETKAGAYVGSLSGGQRQRLVVACALIGDPELAFLDEPTTGLDPRSRRQLWAILEKYRAGGRTILLTTHAMDEAERLCDRVAIIDHGRAIALGSPAELIARLGGEHVIEFSVAGDAGPTEAELQELPGVVGVQCRRGSYRLAVTAPHVTLPALLERTNRDGRSLARLATRHASLEDVFLALTGRRLHDGGADTG